MRTVIGFVIVSQTAALLGDLVLAGIVDRYPAALIALNPRNRNLALATNQLSAGLYYTVGFVRLVVSDPLYYLLGLWYGDRAIAWTERRSRTYGPLIRDGERLFRRASYPLIFLAPNNLICAMAAATGVRVKVFIVLNLTGTVARLVLIRTLGAAFSSPIQTILDLIARYRTPLLILSAVVVAWTVFGEFRRSDSDLNLLRSGDSPQDGGGGDDGEATGSPSHDGGADDDPAGEGAEGTQAGETGPAGGDGLAD